MLDVENRTENGYWQHVIGESLCGLKGAVMLRAVQVAQVKRGRAVEFHTPHIQKLYISNLPWPNYFGFMSDYCMWATQGSTEYPEKKGL